MCYFNNMAIAVQKIRPKAKRVLIIDIDLHYGDGTATIFRGDPDVKMEDYQKIGKAIREGSERCGGRRFAVLEGGYHSDLRYCIKSFIEGFK